MARGRRARVRLRRRPAAPGSRGPELAVARGIRGAKPRPRGCGVVAGLDEVGRGALCGPVVACAVVLAWASTRAASTTRSASRQRQRESLAERIRGRRRRGPSESSGPARDRPVQHPAGYPARHAPCAGRPRAAARTCSSWTALSVPGIAHPQLAIVKGDALSVSIAAASIVAKVARDAHDAGVGTSDAPATGWRTTWATPARITARPCGGWGRARSIGGLSRGRSGGYSRRWPRDSVAKINPVKVKQDAEKLEKAGSSTRPSLSTVRSSTTTPGTGTPSTRSATSTRS